MCHSDQALAKSSAGICTPPTTKAHPPRKRFFLCVKHGHIRIMVGRAGQPKGWPGPL
ncbi:ash family protein [Citrobacter freundii]|nr:ash family protein [Citrobacter freundii]MDH0321273.1 ash family protein [Citrobacter freundii]